MKHGKINTSLFLLSSLLLTACGGGSSTNQTHVQTPSVTTEPTRISDADWQESQVLAREQRGTMQIELEGSKLHINVKNVWRRNSGRHVQIFLDIDNNPETGFRSRSRVWSLSGIDYLIEDGRLYKSKTNSSAWSWKRIAADVSFTKSGNDVDFRLDTSALDGLCNSFTAGNIGRYRNWFIKSIYPVSRKLKSYQVDSCGNTNDTIAPVINLNGANPMTLALNASFTDPGATASDNVDGDISASINATSTVNTAVAGDYSVIYQVSDSSGNATTVTRNVIVDEATPPQGIVIDGNADDWAAIAPISTTAQGTIKAFDDETKLYILIEANNVGANTQLFLDSDNNAQTGFQLGYQTWPGGADYMIENQSLGRATSNSPEWAWDFNNPNAIVTAKTANVVEIAINKSNIQSLSNKILLGFISRDANWSVKYILPESQLSAYQLLHTSNVNHAPIALDDSASLNAGTTKIINVIANDTDSDSDTLTISAVATAQNGTTAITANNQISYTPNAGFTGTDSFTYTINDGNGHNATATVNVTVASNNQAPTAVNDTASTASATNVIVNVLNNDTDPDSDTLTIASVGTAQNGTAVIAGNSISYTPNANFSGIDSFSYTINDGNGHNATAAVIVTVAPPAINHAPDAVEDAPSTDHTVAITINVLANDTDPDGDTLTVTSITPPTFGTTTLNADGSVLFDPQGNIGSITFSYTISDGRGGTDSTVVTIASSDPNDGNNSFPTIVDDNVETRINTAILIDVFVNDFDADGDTLILDQVDSGSNGTTEKVGNKILYTPIAGFTGTDTFYYGVHDGHGHNGSGLVTVTVTPNVTF